uniref:HTH OST-type domain-containing protein n=3 Tax=Wuchereria bancrofti TaxID=6293 RepID=A0AAF5Q296_WUCBA
MSTLDDLKIRIVAVIGSEKNGCTANNLYQIYKDMYGKGLHPEEYGFKDLDSLLVSPTMQGEGGIVYENGRYFAAGDKNTKKMLDLVRNTKSKSRTLKAERRRNALKPSTFMKRELRPVAPAYSNSIKAGSWKLPEWSQMTVNEAISTEKAATKFQENSDDTLKNIPQSNLKAKFYKRHMHSPCISEYQKLELITPMQTSDNNQPLSNHQNCDYVNHSVASISGIQPQSLVNKIEENRMLKSQKGRKRLIKLIELNGGEIRFSEMKNSYLCSFDVSLNNTEICRLFNTKEEEIQNLYEFLKRHLYNDVLVTKCEDDDLLLRVISDENDSDEFESILSSVSVMPQKSLSLASTVVQRDTFHSSFNPNQYRFDFPDRSVVPISSLSKTGTVDNSRLQDSQFPVLNVSYFANDRYKHQNGSTLASVIRTKDDYLPYKVLIDKVLRFVRTKGSFKVSDLSRIFYEEDGRHIDPKNYPEGTWENIIQKLLSSGRYPEFIVRDGVLDLRKDFEKSLFPSVQSSNNCANSDQNESKRPVPLSSIDNSVPAAIIYDLLLESGRPLHQKELLEKLSARGIDVNICQLTVKLITKFKNVFCCKFDLAGTVISLIHDAKRPEEPAVSSCLPSFIESVKIVNHVMSDYCSTTESAGNIFKPVLLIDIALIREPLERFRIQAFFRLRSFEREYNLFEKKMCLHYLSYGPEKDYAIKKPIKDCIYVFHDIKDNRVYRVQCMGDGGHSDAVLVYLIDQMRYQKVPVNQLRKLTSDYARPSYGVVAKTAPFMIVPGRKNEFDKYFSLVYSKLLGGTALDIQADVVSEPSKNLFELKQLYSEVHSLNVPAIFLRQNLIQVFPSNVY